MVEPVRHRRTKGAETDMFEPKATASHLDSTRLRCAVIAVASRLIWQKLTLERSAFHSIRSAQCFGGVLNRRPFLGEKRKTSARAECFSVRPKSDIRPDHRLWLVGAFVTRRLRGAFSWRGHMRRREFIGLIGGAAALQLAAGRSSHQR